MHGIRSQETIFIFLRGIAYLVRAATYVYPSKMPQVKTYLSMAGDAFKDVIKKLKKQRIKKFISTTLLINKIKLRENFSSFISNIYALYYKLLKRNSS